MALLSLVANCEGLPCLNAPTGLPKWEFVGTAPGTQRRWRSRRELESVVAEPRGVTNREVNTTLSYVGDSPLFHRDYLR